MSVTDKLLCLSTSTTPNEYSENISNNQNLKEGKKEANVCSINMTKGQKYFISGMLRKNKEERNDEEKEGDENDNIGMVNDDSNDGTLCNFFLDSGAEISLVQASLVTDFDKISLKEPFEIKGFSGKVGAMVTEKVKVTVDLFPVSVDLEFYVCEIPLSIIGTDLLRDSTLQLDFSTGQEIFTVGSFPFLTTPSISEAEKDLKMRKKQWNDTYIDRKLPNLRKNYWMRTSQSITIKPASQQ